MEDHSQLIESLLERVAAYGNTSLELAKLKALDKTSDVVSSVIPHYVVFVLYALFLSFLSLGFAFWLGEILGNTYYGLFIVAAFYGMIGVFVQLFMHKWLKDRICNYFIKQLLK
ncbi:MAG: hypothetical protein HXX14_03795 [Bacteroidetes bacterium]|nr:hypothetical protein [Bacteroidota bacterium]